jgi:hypothetical protein
MTDEQCAVKCLVDMWEDGTVKSGRRMGKKECFGFAVLAAVL